VAGASAAAAVGVPLGTLAGGWLGWRPAVAALALGAAAVAPAVALAVPAEAPRKEPGDGVGAGALPVLAVTAVWALGSFTAFTYVALLLRRSADVGSAGLALYLALFGASGLAGAAASGQLSDRRGPVFALAAALTATAVALAGLGLVCTEAPGGLPGVAGSGAAIALYGAGTWGVTPPQQERLLRAGGGRLALALNASALYAGIASGGALGGLLLARGATAASLCFAGAAAVLLAALVLALAPRTRAPLEA
jgi:predicted MFS family arabinose efflux permease